MKLLSTHEAIVWWEFQHGKSTGEIADEYKGGQVVPAYVKDLLEDKDSGSGDSVQTAVLNEAGYVSRVLNRARGKIEKTLRDHANSHRLDIESVQDYKGLLIGFDYQANTQVYIIFTLREGVVVWYKHDSYAGTRGAKTSGGNVMNVAKDTTADHLKELYEKIEEVKAQNNRLILETIRLLIPNHLSIEILQVEDLYWRMWAQRSMEF